MSALIKLSEKMSALKKEMSDNAGEAFKEAFKEIHEKNPNILGVHWYQYVPGFNDGDPCTFTMGEINFLVNAKACGLKATKKESKYEESGFYYSLEEGYLLEQSSYLLDDDQDEELEKLLNGEEVQLWVSLPSCTYLTDEQEKQGLTPEDVYPQELRDARDATTEFYKIDNDLFEAGFGDNVEVLIKVDENGEIVVQKEDYHCGY